MAKPPKTMRVFDGTRLRELREARLMTQAELAADLGMEDRTGRVTISRYENGTRAPQLARIREMCRALECASEDLTSSYEVAKERMRLFVEWKNEQEQARQLRRERRQLREQRKRLAGDKR